MYFYLGNCLSLSECINGIFTDEESKKHCKCLNNNKCQTCNKENISNNLCLSCNIEEGYYPKSDNQISKDELINCYKEPEGYFLKNEKYEKCYSSCKYCTELGDDLDNKCTECKTNYAFIINNNNIKNCYEDCEYYYFDENNIYQCSNENECPNEFNKSISFGNKKKCINECKNDNIYNHKYEYLNECYLECPSNTKSSINDIYLCEQIKIIEEEKDKCKLIQDKLNLYKEKILINNINDLTVDYVNQYGISNNFVSKKENIIYTIYTYKNLTCLQETANEASLMDFGECYEKIKNSLGIKEELIITLVNKKNEITSTKFYFSNPLDGKYINASEICAEEVIIIKEDIKALISQLDEKKEEYIIFLTNQGIDVFNLSDEFYNDMCYNYESPNGKDVPMKDRIEAFYPNITLCEEGCENKGVDLETMKAKCECIFGNLMKNNLMDNLYGQAIVEVMDIISSLNIAVFQCIKDIFNVNRFKKCIGGYFILALLLGELTCIIKFAINGLYTIRKYVFSLAESFNAYIEKHPIFNPPKKKSKTVRYDNKTKGNFHNMTLKSSHNLISNRKNLPKKGLRETIIDSPKKTNLRKNSDKINLYIINDSIKGRKSFKLDTFKPNKLMKLEINSSEESNHEFNKIKDLLSPSFDKNDFDDVLNSEKRKYCEYFSENFKNNQIFINAFCIQEKLRPRALKILILIMTIELYFVINALFYNEEYLSTLFNSNKKDSFFSFVPRRFNQFFYSSAVSGIISYLIGYFFVEEEKIKRIFIRNKHENIKLKYDITVLVNDIRKRFIVLICLSIILSIICFIYISCFNIVYPYIREEWIKSSIFILILMQVINFVITFLHCSFRYLAIKYNSQKLFRLSLWLA